MRPVRLLHLGLGSFFRAHQAWYTDTASDADEWGYAAFDGRSPGLTPLLEPQGGAYTLVIRGEDRDELRVVESLSEVHAAADIPAWLAFWASPDVVIVTMTITEAGYRFDLDGKEAAELDALRAGEPGTVRSAMGRIVAGLMARRAGCNAPIVLLPCDNLPSNGQSLRKAVREFAGAVDPKLVTWIDGHAIFGSTMVDRITPATTLAVVSEVQQLTGIRDAAPVPTEPFVEWVVACDFPDGRPDWNATFVDDVEPYEHRKHWLLNGAHTLLAYAGLNLGHDTVASAMDDPRCREKVEQWWNEAQRHLALDEESITRYREALVQRFRHPRIRHELAQIASDGSEKIAARILPTVRAERAAGRVPYAGCYVIGAWVGYLRSAPCQLKDPRADVLTALAGTEDLRVAVRALLDFLDPELARDHVVVGAVAIAAHSFATTANLTRL